VFEGRWKDAEEVKLLLLLCVGFFGILSSAVARHPWDCNPGSNETDFYCFALHFNDFSLCDKISHEGMKFTCHARLRLDKNICTVIDSRQDRNYCFRIVSTELKIRDQMVRSITTIPPERRPTEAWRYPN